MICFISTGYKALLQMGGVRDNFPYQKTSFINRKTKSESVQCKLTNKQCDLLNSKLKSKVSVIDIQISIKSPTSGNLPSFSAGFGINDTMSWLDILILNKINIKHVSELCKYSYELYLSELSPPLSSFMQSNSFFKITSTKYDIILLSICKPNQIQTTFTFRLKILMHFPYLKDKFFYTENELDRKLVPSKLHWSRDLKASSKSHLYPVSIPGTFVTLSLVNLESKKLSATPRVQITWLKDNYEDYVHIQKYDENYNMQEKYFKRCNIKHMSLEYFNEKKYSFCYNFSSSSDGEIARNYYVFFRQFYSVYGYDKIFPHNISWHEASKICEDVGGYLPILRSKKELEELLAMVKLSPFVPPVKGVFIGLAYNISIQVREFFVNCSKPEL